MTTKTEIECDDTAIPWTVDAEYALGFYRMLGRALGIWPLDEQTILSYFQVAFIIITELSMSISLIILILTSGGCETIKDSTDVLCSIASGLLTVLKVLIPKIYYRKMSIIMNTAIQDWNKVHDEQSRLIMLKYAYMGRIIFMTLMAGSSAAGLPLIIFRLPIIANFWNHYNSNISVHSVPLNPSCWVTPDISTINYSAYFTLQSIQLFITCTAYIGGDTYFFGIAMHICGQFELLYASFESSNRISNNNERKKIFCELIQRHQHLLELANNFENVYNLITLGQIMGDTILLCSTILGLLMSLQLDDSMIIISLLLKVYLICSQLFIYCYVGEQLSSQIQNLQTAIYNLNWYNLSYKKMGDIIFIIMRTNYSFHLTAGKVYNMNYENFKNILKGMMSYFSILRLMFLDEA